MNPIPALKAQLSSDELDSLKAENAQLKAQLLDTQSRLDGIHQLLRQTADTTTTSPATSPTPTSTAPATPSTPADAESPTTTPSPASKSAKSSRSRQGGTAQKINQIVDALIR